MSFGPIKKLSLEGVSNKIKLDVSIEQTNVFSLKNSRRFTLNKPQIDESREEFLEKQKNTHEISFKIWRLISLITNLLTILSTIIIIIVWFYWLSLIDANNIRCVHLKDLIIWVVVVYIVGIISQILGLIAGCIKSTVWFLICEVLLIALLALRIVLDVPTINLAATYLEGCARTKSEIDLKSYIYGTIFYCILTMILFTCNITLICSLRKLRKAEQIKHENTLKNDRFTANNV